MKIILLDILKTNCSTVYLFLKVFLYFKAMLLLTYSNQIIFQNLFDLV